MGDSDLGGDLTGRETVAGEPTDVLAGAGQEDLDSDGEGDACDADTKKGKRVDKTDSCVVELDGESISIVDSGGVGDHITWIVTASDTSGNLISQHCTLEVVRPEHQ